MDPSQGKLPDVNKFLSELTIGVGKGLTDAIKAKIKKAWLKKEYGVTIQVEEADALKKISENEFYILFKKYLGGHWSVNLVKVGIYISQLQEEGKKKRASELHSEAYKKYGPKGARIIHLASTGILVPIMDYIIDLKLIKDANYITLSQEFDKILDEWDKISIPVNLNETEESIKIAVINKMDTGYSIFFVYAAGGATKIAQLTLAKMNNEK